jgi:TonB family protein
MNSGPLETLTIENSFMRTIPLMLAVLLLVSCARNEPLPEATAAIAALDADIAKAQKSIAEAAEKASKDEADFRGRTFASDVAQWALTPQMLAEVDTIKARALAAKSPAEVDTAIGLARKRLGEDLERVKAIVGYWVYARPAPFWRTQWEQIHVANGVPVPAPDPMLESIEARMRTSLDAGDFVAASEAGKELGPVLIAALDREASQILRTARKPEFVPRKSPCPRGVAPEAGQSKPQLIDSRPVNEFYPPSAIARGETGSLVLRARVDREGCAKEFAIAVRSAVPALDAAALEWFETARYSPATRGGRAVDAEHTFKVKFVLDETPAG